MSLGEDQLYVLKWLFWLPQTLMERSKIHEIITVKQKQCCRWWWSVRQLNTSSLLLLMRNWWQTLFPLLSVIQTLWTYIRQGRHASTSVHLMVGWLVCQQDNMKTKLLNGFPLNSDKGRVSAWNRPPLTVGTEIKGQILEPFYHFFFFFTIARSGIFLYFCLKSQGTRQQFDADRQWTEFKCRVIQWYWVWYLIRLD